MPGLCETPERLASSELHGHCVSAERHPGQPARNSATAPPEFNCRHRFMFALSRIHCSTSQRASALAGRLAGAFALFGTSPAAAQVSSEQVFVTPDWAREHAEVWVDARDDVSYALSHHPDAVHLPWTDFTTRSQSGLLLSTDQLQGRLGTAGISRDLTVVVYDE